MKNRKFVRKDRIIHDYLPNEFDAEKLFENLRNLDDFRKFSKYVLEWITGKD